MIETIMEIEEDIKNKIIINKDNKIKITKIMILEIETETENSKIKEIILILLKFLEIHLQELTIM